MQRIPIFSLLLVMLFSLAMFADEESAESLREKEARAKELAQEILTGRQIRVRIYNDWKKDPKAYRLVAVKLDRLSFQYDTIKENFGPMSKSTVIVVAGQDQSDETVAAIIGDFIYAAQYKEKASFYLWPPYFDDRGYRWDVFRDAHKEPIPNAMVEIMIGREPYQYKGPRISIRKVKLDEKGRMKPLMPTSSLNYFSFMVSHPDYGGDMVWAKLSYMAKDEKVRVHVVPILPRDKWCVFRDALGNPIPKATVEIINDLSWRDGKSKSIGKVQLDEKGRLKPPQSNPRLECCFIVSHPDYGTALVEPRLNIPPDKLVSSCTVPLVRAGTKADERSIWGTIVDTNDKPVAEALIECRIVETPGGGEISMPRGRFNAPRAAKSITDKQGRFALYMPIEKNGDKRIALIPLASKYHVWIQAPKALGLQRYDIVVESGQETTITMQFAKRLKYLPTFVFEDEFGPVVDPNMLKHVWLRIECRQGWSRRRYFNWVKRGEYVPGTYQATADWYGKHYIFEPVELGVETQQTIVFKIKEVKESETIYQGRVVHGITGEPMPGAFVVTGGVAWKDFSILTPEQWRAMHALPNNPDLDAPALVPLRKICNFKNVVRTDPNGWFRMGLPPHSALIGVTAFEQNHLGVNHRWDNSEFSRDSVVKVPTLKLFPSATLIIDLNVPVKSGDEDIRFRFRMSPENNPSWLTDFLECFHVAGNPGVVYKHQLRLNQPNSINVPAGLEMTARIFNVKNRQWRPIVIENIKLEQGQVLDMGRRDFPPTLKVAVKVIDSSGEPVEGVTVGCSDKVDIFWGSKGITNEDGIAFLFVSPHSKGKFTVRYFEEPLPDKPLQESAVYEVAGKEDEGKQFTLQISDEMLYQLFK